MGKTRSQARRETELTGLRRQRFAFVRTEHCGVEASEVAGKRAHNRARRLAVGVAALAALASPAFSLVTAAPLSYRELLARDRPVADRHIRYGASPSQYGELWLPPGSGPHRVVILIHGGCWLASLPGLELMAYAAEDLRRRGNAVWNIEYRRLGDAGGGYPGTFEDVADAVDWVRSLAKSYPLDLDNVVVAGHSAGGHLALWAGARFRLAKTSALYRENPFRIRGAVSLAGVGDLQGFRDRGRGACGEPETVDRLVGAAGPERQDVFSDTSPAALLPFGVRQVIVVAMLDPIVPAAFGRQYVGLAASAGDPIKETAIPDTGHFELIDPRSAAFEKVRSAIEELQK